MTSQPRFWTSEESSETYIFRRLTIKAILKYNLYWFGQVFQKLWQYKWSLTTSAPPPPHPPSKNQLVCPLQTVRRCNITSCPVWQSGQPVQKSNIKIRFRLFFVSSNIWLTNSKSRFMFNLMLKKEIVCQCKQPLNWNSVQFFLYFLRHSVHASAKCKLNLCRTWFSNGSYGEKSTGKRNRICFCIFW